jgi:hypothetical protein
MRNSESERQQRLHYQTIMKFFLLIVLIGGSAWAQQSAWSGNFNAQGSMLTPAVVGSTSVALPDPALLNWKTDIGHTPSPGSVVTIGNGTTGICAPSGCTFTASQLSIAINSLSCGQTLEMQNTVYMISGSLTLNKVCDQAHWITIERDTTDSTFPAEGTRVTPCYSGIPSSAMTGMPAYNCPSPARHMPLIQKTAAGGAINIFGSYYRFVGIEWGRNNSYDLDFGIITMNNNGVCAAPDVTCMNAQPTNNIFDRNIIHGDAQRQTVRAISLGGTRWVAVLDSYIYDIGLTVSGGGGDAQPFGWGNGKFLTNEGFGKFANNFESASTMGNLFCGSFCEPLSPSTGFDGVPHDVWFDQNWFYKNPLWDTQMGQTQQLAQNIEGVNYGPTGDQEFVLLPATMQLQVGQTITLQSLTANDSWSGINRSPAGTTTVTCGSADCGSSSTSFTNIGTGAYVSQNQFKTTFTAPATVPTGATVNVTRSFSTGDGRLATLGNSRTLSATSVFTIVAGTPTPQIVLSPKISDLQIQPSYSDANGNNRQFCLLFTAISNFTSASMAWKVDGVANGDSTRGRMCSITSANCIAPGSNDQTAAYCSGTAGTTSQGTHTISVSNNPGVTDSSAINVSATAPIVGWDYRAFTSKNGFELKCGGRILLENFFIENAWGSNGNGGGQGGQFILIHPFNQNGCTGAGANCSDGNGVNVGYGPFNINDITIRYGKGLHLGAGFVIGGSNQTSGIRRVSVTNVLGDDVSRIHWSHGFASSYFATQANSGPSTVYTWESAINPMMSNVSYRHVTLVGDNPNTFGINQDVAQPKSINYTVQDSFFASPNSTTFLNPNGGSTNCNIASGSGSSNSEARALVPCFNGYVFNHLALLDSTASPTVFLSSPIWQPASTAVGFVNYNGGNGGDYRLCKGPNNPSSSCTAASVFAAGQANQASDGTDLGADISRINAVESAVRSGVRTP